MTDNDKTTVLISLPTLLSTCADASIRGCAVIRTVYEKRARRKRDNLPSTTTAAAAAAATAESNDELSTTSNDNEGDDGVTYKIEGDVRSALTEADGAAQRVIITCLRERWGVGLKIVGEEEEGDEANEDEGDGGGGKSVFETYGVDGPSVRPLDDKFIAWPSSGSGSGDVSAMDSSFTSSWPPQLPLSEVIVFVDPLDGTREFVEGRLANVQCLIGITCRGLPVAGVVALPFDGEDHVKVFYGIDGETLSSVPAVPPAAAAGIEAEQQDCSNMSNVQIPMSKISLPAQPPLTETCHKRGKNSNDQNEKGGNDEEMVTILTGDSQSTLLQRAITQLHNLLEQSSSTPPQTYQHILTGGCGNKLLRIASVVHGRNTIAIMHPGTSSWDTAAPTALLRAASSTGDGNRGKVTDWFGEPLIYDGIKLGNTRGVVATGCGTKVQEIHYLFCKAAREDFELSKLLNGE